ncbi:hypothetical protein F8388_010039 [Cannabis sativa]|nr:hypothetical protein F8388_010039 [Cannabis sativa]
MKHNQANNDHHHHHQYYYGLIYKQFCTKKVGLLALIFLVILTTVPIYHPCIKYSSFFSITSSSSLLAGGVDDDDLDDIKIESSSTHKCDIFSGEWVPNPEAPYYTNDTCWAIHEHQNCMKYGRPDSEFIKWKWKPDACNLPVFNPAQFLELVRDKSLAFVGDSVARNQMQSLICLLSRVEYPIDESYTSNEQYKRWKYTTYNFTLATYWTPHLVKAQKTETEGPTKTGLFNLYLDELDEAWTAQMEDFDYIILSGGQWFYTPMVFYENHKIIGCHFCQLPNVTNLGMYYGYRRAMRTALKAINGLKNYKGVTYLRTFAPSHFEGGLWNQGGNCVRTVPFKNNETVLEGPSMEFYMIQVEEFRNAEREGRKRGLKFRMLDTTQAMLLRPDGHPSKYGHSANVTMYNDCVHWCLPGPIDTWNDFLLEMIKTERLRSADENLRFSDRKLLYLSSTFRFLSLALTITLLCLLSPQLFSFFSSSSSSLPWLKSHMFSFSSFRNKCSIFRGNWVYNPDKRPFYTNFTCPEIYDQQNCMKFGRPDSEFLKWSWKPAGSTCDDLPSFDAAQFLELVKGKSIAFVGDSVARNQMQSLLCLLATVEYPTNVSYKSTDTKFRRWLAFRTAFKALLGLEKFKGEVILRTLSPAHFENGEWNKGGECKRTEPVLRSEMKLSWFEKELYLGQIEELRVVESEGKKKGVRFRVMDVTEAMVARPDGHPNHFGHWPHENVTIADCVHWCLPGPIDTWNEFLFQMLKA